MSASPDTERGHELTRDVHATIKKVTDDMSGQFAFNTAIAALMKLNNSCSKTIQEGISRDEITFALQNIASLLFPFAPHVASEVYYLLTGKYVWQRRGQWPMKPGCRSTRWS
ncbi:MAG: class I tRNA ligase family protein [Pseudonocardiales bacterium]|nr:class I tRNA ligase family protein [Pseudonocardiales bacterium]